MRPNIFLRLCVVGIFASLACGATLPVAVAQSQSNPIVAVTGGQVRGRALQMGAVFKGIPFAAPPVGDLRWKPPMPVTAWTGVRDAGEYGPPCVQQTRNGKIMGSEDCLTLNVWTPEWPSKSKKAVMMWIYGGGYQGGSASDPLFDGESLSKHDVVVVTIQYRPGIFGFLAHPELTAESPHHASGNYGTMDQMAALKWIQANIAKFGGDAANVTVFGCSGGGNSTGQMLVSPLSEGLLARAIEQSGTLMGDGRLRETLAEAEAIGVAVAAKKGVPATGSIAYLRKLSAEDLLTNSRGTSAQGYAIEENMKGVRGADPHFGPNADGYVIKEVSAKTLLAGQEKKVPLMIGNTARERTLSGDTEALKKAVAAFYGPRAERAMETYSRPSTYPPYGNGLEQFATDVFTRCPSVTTSLLHTAAGNVIWAYEFSHPYPEAPERGAEHANDQRYVFGNFPSGSVADLERKISNDMQTYWTNFAKTGDPNGGGLPRWPEFDAKGRGYLEFTDGGPVAKKNLRRNACQLFEEQIKQKIAAAK